MDNVTVQIVQVCHLEELQVVHHHRHRRHCTASVPAVVPLQTTGQLSIYSPAYNFD